MLLDDVPQTIDIAEASLQLARDHHRTRASSPELYLESLSISHGEKQRIARLALEDSGKVDPVVAHIIGATNGRMYKHLIGKLDSYPIPELRLSKPEGESFLDLGCNWGRWCIAAARKGYNVVGIDPSLGAIMAAKRVADSLGLSIRYVVGDARYLPFSPTSFDNVFSYSVLQHLKPADLNLVLPELGRVLKQGGLCLVQMPTTSGVLCIYHQARRLFREASGFEVRYWSVPTLKRMFTQAVGRAEVSVDCYFGIGIQKNDYELMPQRLKLLILISEMLRRLSGVAPFLQYVADSVYITAVKC